MAVIKVDAIGLKCPQPILKLATKSVEMKTGDILEISGDCPTFELDIRTWCGRLNKTVISVKEESGAKICQIQF
ncbi:MAG: sulfurtransferase TusA family protein [Candidatus Omnitrophota bacterium]